MTPAKKIIMLGATGAVGNHTALALSKSPLVEQLTFLGRRPVENIDGKNIFQHTIDIFSPNSYETYLNDYDTAICTLGVGQPSKISKDEFVKIDKNAVLDFAIACKNAGIKHFELLSSIGANSKSSSFYLRIKGQLEDGLKELGFERLSFFRPSMIMTPTNRYGLSQAFFLKVMPLIDPLLIGSFQKYRSIPVDKLGKAIAMNVFNNNKTNNVEILHWNDFVQLTKSKILSNR